jgi:excisionase family DNA binding protein
MRHVNHLYTVDQAAELLGLHVKTVRGYVRDGRLKATRIGRSYRIARADLEAFAGVSLPTRPWQASARQRQAHASVVIRVDAVSPDLRDRVAGLVSGIAASPSESSERLHITVNYDEEHASMTVILTAGLTSSAEILRLVSALVDG